MNSANSYISATHTIRKSDNDSWNYRGLELANGIKCILISSPELDKAAAALSISVGSLADPHDTPGVAHFLEHMLFMGSTKYPRENEYDEFIISNGGRRNAETSLSNTIYFFDINPDQLPHALDIFANMFISPLIDSSCVDRELKAVNSEFDGIKSVDTNRISQIMRSTSDPLHPHSGFLCGNIESLKLNTERRGIDIRQIVKRFYKQEYSANRMTLAVVGKHSLDELESLVVENFKNVPNKQLPTTIYPADPVGETRRKTVFYIVPIAESRTLTITWVTPDYRSVYYCEPASHVAFLINHEGIGSLSSYLKKKGLISSIECPASLCDGPGFNSFMIYVELTTQGLEHWQDVVYNIYQYMAMVRKLENQHEQIFNERQRMRQIRFQFYDSHEPIYTVTDVADNSEIYPLTDCLFGQYDLRDFSQDLINTLLDDYLTPSKMRIFLASKQFTEIATEQEKWHGTQYKQEYLSETFIKKCETCDLNDDLHLPMPNDFIPTDFHLFHNQQSDQKLSRSTPPRKIEENEHYRLYYAEDTFYKMPKALMYFNLRNHFANVDPIHLNMNKLYITLVNDSLSEISYPASLGDIYYNLWALSSGIQLEISGYNDKIGVIFEIIIDHMINLHVDPHRLEVFKERRKRALKDFHKETPADLTANGLDYLMSERIWHEDELLYCIDEITVDDIKLFMRQMLARFYVDSLMYGNLTEEQSIGYMKRFQEKFHQAHLYRPAFSDMWFDRRQLMLTDGCNYATTMLNDANHMNAIKIYLQCFQDTIYNDALLGLFVNLVQERCFDQLRTKEQLGYDVSCGEHWDSGAGGFILTVQMQKNHNVEFVHQRIEHFLDSLRDFLENISDEQFLERRDAYMEIIMEIPKSIYSQGNAFWNEIDCHQFCFDRHERMKDAIEELERDHIIEFYDWYISPRSNNRRKLTIFVKPSPLVSALPLSDEKDTTNTEAANNDVELNLPEFKWIDNIPLWKSQLSCYPSVVPYDEIDVPVHYKL